jgi:probable HAF family extracellular repeat protein
VQVNDAGSVIGEYGTLSEGGGFIKTKDAFIPITWPGMNQMGGDIAYAHGLNSNDIVVGAWGNTVVGPFPMSYRWEKGVLQNLDADMPLKGGNWANAISDNGLITGYMGFSAAPPNHHAYIWNDGQVVDLGTPFANCAATEGRSINSKGHVCGVWWKTTDSPPSFVKRSFFYDGKQMIDLGQYLSNPNLIMHDLNESDQVVGFAGIGNSGWALLWQNGKLYRLDDLIEQSNVPIEMRSAEEITNNGTIFGYGKVPGFGSMEAIRLTPNPPRAGDVDCDADVDVDDLLGVINQWGRCELSCDADLNIDGVVGSEDLMTVISDWDE